MADPTTANTSLSVPIRGTDVGTWDVPINGNFTVLDSMFGGVQVYAPTNVGITIASTGGQTSIIRLTGTLTGNVAITLPNIWKFWTIDNQLSNTMISSYYATLVSTSGASIIGIPPGQQDIFYDGTTVNYRNLGRVGEYWDFAGPSVPTWVSACTKAPYLNCDGTSFSSATYPVLANLLGGTTLPDARGRFRAALNQTTGRLTSSQGGVDGNTILASSGLQTTTLASSNLPPYTPAGTVNTTISQQYLQSGLAGGSVNTNGNAQGASTPTATSSFTGTPAAGQVSNPFSNVPPAFIFGITLIRAA